MSSPVLTRARISRRLAAFGAPVMGPLIVSLLCRVLAQLLGIGLLVVAVTGLARVARDPESSWTPYLWALVAMSLAKGIARYLEQFAGHTVAFRVLALMRVDFYDRLVPQSPAGILSRRSGDLVARATKDVDRVEVFFAHTLVPVASAILVPVVVVVYAALAWDPVVAALLAAGALLAGLAVPTWGASDSERAAARVRVARGAIAQHVTESAQGIREVLAFGAATRRREEAGALADQASEGLGSLGTWTARRRGTNAALVVLSVTAVVAVGLWRLDALGADGVAVVAALAVGLFPVVLAVEDVAPDLEQAFASARRIWTITDAPPHTASPASPTPVPDGPVGLVFEDVTFAYPPVPRDAEEVLAAGSGPARATASPPVLDRVGLRVPAGSVTAIVGPSGSGKSTLAHLLTRAWDPDEGRILLGGVDVRDLSLADLRRAVGVVGQHTYVFNDTIAANLRLAAPDATDDQLVDACRRVALHDTIAARPDGYDTVVGELGERLSGGQRQRLALARVLLMDSPVLVLDEATSQLDVETEALIHDALVEVCRDRTVLVIAHRPGAVDFAHEVHRIDELGGATPSPPRSRPSSRR